MPRKKKVPTEKEEFSEEESFAEEDETPSEELKSEMESGEREEEVYSEEGREKLVEDAEISPEEQGFMEGAEGRGEQASCTYCGKLLGEDEKNIIERKFNGEIKWFCSEEHAQKYAERIEKQKQKSETPEK